MHENQMIPGSALGPGRLKKTRAYLAIKCQ